jgi:hypothetical protein
VRTALLYRSNLMAQRCSNTSWTQA